MRQKRFGENSLSRRANRTVGLAVAALLLSGTAGMAKQATEAASINSFSGAFLAARVAEVDNELDAAIAYYKRALSFDPGNQALQQSLLLALISNGNFDDSLVYAEKLKAVPEVERFSRVALAVRDIKTGKFDDARIMLKLSLESDLDRLISGLLTAWAEQGDGDGKAALATIAGLEGPEWYDLFKSYHSALIAEAAGLTAEADKSFAETVDNASAGGAAPDTWLRAAEAQAGYLARKGDRTGALEALDKADQFAAGRISINRMRDDIDAGKAIAPMVTSTVEGAAEVLLDLGSALNRGGGEPFVKLYLQLSLALRPQSDAALLQLAGFAEQQQDAEGAIALYRRIAESSPMRRAAELQLGLNLADLDRHAEAEADLKKLLASDPDDMRAYLALGGVYSSQDKYADSARIYDQAVSHLEDKTGAAARSNGAGAANWNIYYQRGIAYERLKQWDKAEPNFRKALALAPEQPQVLNYLGYSMVDMNRNLDEALGMIQKAVDLRPSDGYIVDSLGWAFYKLGRYEDAVRELERAVSLKPDDAVLNDHLGDAYWRVGRKLEATFQWSHARDLKPDADVLTIVMKKLAEGLPDVPPKATAEEPAVKPPAVEPIEPAKEEQRTEVQPVENATPISAAYKVMPGQSLWSIADDVLGNGGRYLEILNLNPQLRGNAVLQPGQELVLPAGN